jgi:uncharacterized protein
MTYDLLPFRFERLASEHELITNEVGEFLFVTKGTVSRIIRREIDRGTEEYKDLLAKHVIVDDKTIHLLDILCTKLRTKKNHLGSGIALQLVVITRRCNQSCKYCQVSRRDCNEHTFDMSNEVIDKVVDAIIATSSNPFTLEIQGGEPLLAMDKVKYLINRAKEKAASASKQMNIVICTNLTLADSDFYKFCKDHNVSISTSLDGPQYLHNAYRVLPDGSSHTLVIDRIKKAFQEVGIDKVSALMTTTKDSLKHPKDIIDEYISLGLHHIFIRKLNKYGHVQEKQVEIYSTDEFIEFYKKCLSYIIEKNKEGQNIIEVLATIMLRKILTPYNTGYVDLLSPPGLGTSFMAYDHNGNVFPSDEARMLSAMGDDTFLLGNLCHDKMEDIFCNPKLKDIHYQAMAEGVPGCVDCVFLPYCGSDPIYHYNTQSDIVGNKSHSGFCKFNKEIFRYLFRKIQKNDPEEMNIFWSWVRNIPIAEMEQGLPGYD